MPRIPDPEEVRPLGAAQGLPRAPLNVRGATQALDEFIQQAGRFGAVSQSIADRMVRQERQNALNRLQADLATNLNGLQERVDRMEPSDARRTYDAEIGGIVAASQRQATGMGLGEEFDPILDEAITRRTLSVHQGIASRLDASTLKDLAAAGKVYEDQLAGARSKADYEAGLAEFAGLALRTSEAVPEFTQRQARALIREVGERGQTRRAEAVIRGALGNGAALAAAQSAVLDESQFPNLPTDTRATLSGLAYQLRAQAADEAWQQQQRQYALQERARQATHLDTMEGMMGRLAAGGQVSDQEITLALANGSLDPTLANFVSGWRDGQLTGVSTDLHAYDTLRQQAEYGMLDETDVYRAMNNGELGQGQSAVSTAKGLLDTNAVAKRSGGVMRDDEVKASRTIIQQVILGSVGDSPEQLITDFMNASDTERRLVTRAQVEFDARMAEYQAAGVLPENIQPRKVAGQVLKAMVFKPLRPTPPMASLEGLKPEEIETTMIPKLQLALDNASAADKRRFKDALWEVRAYADKLRGWQKSVETMDALTGDIKEAP